MISNSFDPESEALYRILRGEPTGDIPAPNSEDAEFAASIRQTAQNIQADPFFQADLETRLKRITPNAPKSTRQWFSGFTRNLAWAVTAIVLVFVVTWSIRNLLPQPLAAATPTILPSASETPVPTSTPLSELKAGTPEGDVYTSPLFPDNSIILKAEFPTSPAEAKIYIQNFDERLTFENGLALAKQLGVDGKIYNVEEEAGQMTNFYVTDGISRVLIYSPHHFFYVPNYQKVMGVSKQYAPTTENQISMAEAFLKEHGLLDFPYRIKTEDSVSGLVRFVQLLDDKSITYGAMGNPEISMQLDSQGEIKSLNFNVLDFTESGSYPIISAEEAWQKTLLSGYPEGLETDSNSISPGVNETWLREYPVGESVELFGYPEILRPAVAGADALLFINYYPLQGNLQELTNSANPSQFMQIWGKFETDENGNLFFQVEGWQPSPFPDQVLEGVIQRQGDQGYLMVDNIQWLLPGLPEDIPDGLKVYARGITLEAEATLDWSTINTNMGGGGGGGGGSGFVALNLERAPTPVPVPTATPYQLPKIGDRFDGIQGNPFVTYFENADGSTKLYAIMNLQPSEEWTGGLSLTLAGDGLAGIDAYHQLPVKIWGSITDFDQSVPIVTVERYEPVYPDIKAQTWMGTLELVSLGNNSVLMFTDQSGNQYVLNTSLETEAKTPTADMPFIIEGVVYPDQTFEGYPVLHDFLMFGAQGMENLDDYKPQSITPMTLNASIQHFSDQTLTVEKIELVNYTGDMRYVLPDNSIPPMYVQPAWRFYGHYENGNVFEILVQALSDEYLQ